MRSRLIGVVSILFVLLIIVMGYTAANGLAQNPDQFARAIAPERLADVTYYSASAAYSDNALYIHRFDTGALVRTLSVNTPYGLTWGPDDALYIVDEGDKVIYRLSDPLHGSLTTFVTGIPQSPNGLTFGPDGNLYVLTPNYVYKYNGSTGAYMGIFISGLQDGKQGIRFGPDGNLYVNDEHHDKVLRYNGTTGSYLGVYATVPSGQGARVFLWRDGYFYLGASFWNGDKIYRYVDHGSYASDRQIFVEGVVGGDHRIRHPTGFTFGPDGNLYIASMRTNNIQKYAPYPSSDGSNYLGDYISSIGWPKDIVFFSVTPPTPTPTPTATSTPTPIPATLGDRAWSDTDADGIQDAGESGLSGVTVELYDNDSCSGSATATMTTDSSGNYSFDNLAPGTYSLKFVLPSGYVFSPANQGTDDSVDSDADTSTGCTGAITLSAGQNDTSWDAGMYQPTPVLLIDKDTSTTSVPAGGQATYTIVVRNNGTGVAHNVTVWDVLPDGFTYNHTLSVQTSGPVTRTSTVTPINTLLNDGRYIYAFGGKNTPNFWRYDLTSSSWQVMANAPGNVHAGGDIAMGNGYIYGMGGGSTNAFWRYDPATNTWDDAAAADVPLPPGKEVGTGGALTYDDHYIYAIVGGNDSSTDNDLWRYDPNTDTWTLITHTPVPQSGGSDITYGDGYIYFLGGNNGNDDPGTWGPENPGYEFYRYNIATNTWERLHDLPNVEPAKEGAAIVFHGGSVLGNTPSAGSVYAWVGGDKKLYYRYDIATDTWIQAPPADSPYEVENGSDLCSDSRHDIYGFPATDTQYFQVYDTNNDNWTQLTQTPAQVHDGGSLLCALGNGTPRWGTWEIGAGGSITITFVVDIASSTPEGTYDNTAYASADNHSTIDDDGTQAQDADTPSGQDPENDEDVTVTTATGSIGDRVWNDADADGIQDAGESGLSGVTVELYDNDSCSGSATATTTTDSSGNYSFDNLAPGTYSLKFVLPSGYVFSPANQGTDDSVDSDADTSTGCTGAITLSAGENDMTLDAGMHSGPQVAVTKWVPDQDSVQDNVVLVGSTVNFQVIITNTGSTTLAYVPLHDAYDTTCLQYTAKSANPPENQRDTGTIDWLDLTISFSRDLAPGESFTVTIPFQAVAPDDEATNTATVQDARDLSNNAAPDASSTASVVCRQPASIGDRVWNDANNNQVQDAGENGINGVTVRLYKDDGDDTFEPGGDDVLVATQTTSGDGDYDFTMLHAGTYWVDVVDSTVPTGYELNTGNDPLEVTVNYGDDYNDADFGYVGRGDIFGIVFYDWDEDGQQDAGEDGISNVHVCLYLDDGDNTYDSGDTLQECQNTDTNGSYRFDDYLPGTYFVVEDQPPGLESTTPDVRKVDLVVTGTSGSSTDNNFGEIVKGRIGDFVWVDSDGDGVQDAGETTGIANVPLHVTGVNIIDETLDITVTTSVTGYYTVEDLLPGTYTVTAPASYSSFVRTSPSPLTTTLTTDHMEDLSLDFGYISPTGVELIRFDARAEMKHVTLQWAVQNRGTAPSFHVWRTQSGGVWTRLTQEPVTPKALTGWEVRYEFVDETVQPGRTYLYRLETEDGLQFGPWEVAVLDPGQEGSGHMYLPMILRR